MTAVAPTAAIQLPSWAWAVAGHGLAATAPIDRRDLDLSLALEQGLAGLLAAADRDGALALAPGERARLDQHLAREAELALRLEAELLRLAPVLARHGGVVLKGPALAHAAYPDPAVRPFTDLDLLVAPASIPRVLRDLGRLGYERPRPDPTPTYAARVAKATALVHPAGLVVDLHRTVTPGHHGHGIDVLGLLADRIEVAAGPVPVPAPSWEAHLVVVALHAVIGDHLGRARSVRDVAQVALRPGLDAEAAAGLAVRWGAEVPLAVALRTAAERFDVILPPPLAHLASTAAPVAVADADADAGRHRPASPSSASADRRLTELRRASGGLRSSAALWRSLVAPSPAFLRWTYGDASLPELYLRRWRDLGRRRAQAHGGSR
jgi:hypothetical protein